MSRKIPVLDLAAMTWKCNVCGRERPDAQISVAHRPGPWIREDVRPTWNIRYCNDRPACAEYAKLDGEWTGPAEQYKVDIACEGISITELGRAGAISGLSPYPVSWSSVRDRTHAIFTLHAADAESAERHCKDVLSRDDVHALQVTVTT